MDKSSKALQKFIQLARGLWCVSYSKSHVPDVIRYVQNQEIQHRKETFLNEYRKMLKVFDVEYDEQYIFEELI